MKNKKLFRRLTNLFSAILLALLPNMLFAQNGPVAMADQFRADGKIYVVIVVIITIFIGIIFYLFSLDKKIKRLEQNNK